MRTMDIKEQKKIIKDHLIAKLGEPKDHTHLDRYIDICVETRYDSVIGSLYHKHHILPKSKFPEFSNLKDFDWNCSILHFEDHKNAHSALATAYPIAAFIIPIHYFGKENKQQIIGTLMWEYMREHPEILERWKENRSAYMKSVMTPGNKIYESSIERLKKRWEDPNERIKVAKHFSDLHLDPEYKKKAIENAKAARANQETLDKWKESCKQTWESEKYRQKLRDKLSPINKDEEKRLDASKKIKELWQDPEFRNKSIASRKEGNRRRKLAGQKRGNSQKMKEKWANPEFREMMIAKRKNK